MKERGHRINYSRDVPQVEARETLTEKVNAAIQETMDRHLEQRAEGLGRLPGGVLCHRRYGGGVERPGDGVTCGLHDQVPDGTRVSFEVSFAGGVLWVAAGRERYYYNLDLAENRNVTLRTSGEDWVEIRQRRYPGAD